MDIGIIGTGNVARTLADAWRAAGHTVTLGSRTPSSDTVEVADLVRSHQVLVNATPGSASLEAIDVVSPKDWAGKILIDVANAITPSFELLYPNDSLGSRLQTRLPDTKVVKTMNTAGMALFTHPNMLPATSVFLSGNDEESKTLVASLIRDFGWSNDDIVDLGDIGTARGVEHYFFFFNALMRSLGAPVSVRVVSAS